MMFEVIKRRLLLSFLLLTNLILAWSLFVTEHRRGQLFKLARLDQQLPPLVDQPPPLVDQPPPLVEPPPPPPLPPLVENPLMPKPRNRRVAQPPPPPPKGASGPGQ
ncbi:hypothetical protein CMV_020747 [Castanea mollissima]|uniref:Uncharacterized protein n=1 Tax=Castanea mollissima TaxID=60419 RepID=A0A8J4QVZ0_9ROSI|nr:hypothetical protein CMV_020747 [Castanea mollissima]